MKDPNTVNKKIVIYTAIVGDYDYIREPKYVPINCDFICFTDQTFKSKVWKFRAIEQWNNDSTRTARMYKILPHKFLSEYDISIWTDGNIQVIGNLNQAIHKYLANSNMAVYSHACLPDRETSVYHHAEVLISGKNGRYKDDPEIIRKQMNEYKTVGFPDDKGILSSMIMFRRHNESDVVATMEQWWSEVATKSKRDQLSFNFSAWRSNLNFQYINDDSRSNEYFVHTTHARASMLKRLEWLFRKKIPSIFKRSRM